MIFNDLQKLLLYQQLNLGFQCIVCKKRFYNKLEYTQHIVSCKSVSETLKCDKCEKTFGHKQILKLHQQFHSLSEPTTKVSETQYGSESLSSIQLHNQINPTSTNTTSDKTSQCQRSSTDNIQDLTKSLITKDGCRLPFDFKFFESPKKTTGRVSRVAKEKSKPANKRIGLTKVKIEDCLRCDDCSCIYIDDKDYYKHMRNFHKLDMNNLPIPQPKSKRKCKSCCKQCRGVNCTSASALKRPRATQPASNLIFKINMRDNIKNRWSSMLSHQLTNNHTKNTTSAGDEEEDIKPDLNALLVKSDPDSGIDINDLLSQEEVKIKTEPDVDFFI